MTKQDFLGFIITLLFSALFGYCLIGMITPNDNPEDYQREVTQDCPQHGEYQDECGQWGDD